MIIKIYNAFLKISTFVLLVLSLWLVVNGALKESKGHFEFGNLMDLFNTAGTLGTLFVAYKAFKAAPNWFNQKMDEAAFDIANDFITHDVPIFKKFINELVLPFEYYPSDSDYFSSHEFNLLKKQLNEDEEANKKLKLIELHSNLELMLRKLSRLGWNLKNKNKEEFDLISNNMSEFYSVYIVSSVGAVMWLTPDKNSADYNDSITFVRDNLNKDRGLLMSKTKELSDRIDDFLKKEKRFDQYFIKSYN